MAEQEIKGFDWLEDIELEPETLRRIYTSDFFQRTLSHLFAKYRDKWVALQADANGYLLVQSPSQLIEKCDVKEVTASDTESALYTFSFPEGIKTTKVVEVHVGTNPILIRFVPEDDSVLPQIYHSAGMVIMRGISIKGFKVQNAVAGQTATARIIGWF